MTYLFEKYSLLFIFLLGLLLGIISYELLIFFYVLISIIFILILYTFFIIRKYIKLPIIFLMSILLGFFRNDLSKYDISRDSFSYYYNQEIVVTGDIVETPVNKQNSQEVVVGNLNIIKSDNEIIPLNGKMLLQTRNFPEYYYGEVLQIEGEITEPISLGEFDYKSYLENQGIYGVVRFPYISIISENGGNVFVCKLNVILTDFSLNQKLLYFLELS